jgi:HD-GYP domain-containing protein (c-di-GMP phosphodiesterase class II)
LGSRIFSVADTLDAITSDRPYRQKQSIQAARAEIQRCSGTQFDPNVVLVFQQMPDDIFEELRRAISAQIDPMAYSAGAKL